jgi:hypothetical protein
MTERIDELMIEAGARFEFLHGVHYDDFQYKKFAELIVQECTNFLKDTMDDHFAAEQLEEHFGVEE